MHVDLGLLAFSFSAGVAAFFNPCGFALLPSYVSFYLTSQPGSSGRWAPLRRGAALGGAVSAGFLAVFAGVGVVLSWVGSLIARILPWASAAVGVTLIALGALMLAGRSPVLPWHPDRWVHARLQGRDRRSLGFYFLYGIAYALCSISCTIPIFIVVVAQAFALSALNGVIHFIAYGLGMTLMMLALSLVMAFSKHAIGRHLPSLMRWVRPLGAWILIGAGGYLVYYNLVYAGLLD